MGSIIGMAPRTRWPEVVVPDPVVGELQRIAKHAPEVEQALRSLVEAVAVAVTPARLERAAEAAAEEDENRRDIFADIEIKRRLRDADRETIEKDFAFLPEVYAKVERFGLTRQFAREQMSLHKLPKITLSGHGVIVKRERLHAWLLKHGTMGPEPEEPQWKFQRDGERKG